MYESLISNLREHAERVHAIKWDPPIALGDDLEEAIKSIKDLKAELQEAIEIIVTLGTENARLRQERDAAVRDLETIMFVGGQNTDTCNYCKTHTCYDRNGCKPCNPKWRGPDGRGEDDA